MSGALAWQVNCLIKVLFCGLREEARGSARLFPLGVVSRSFCFRFRLFSVPKVRLVLGIEWVALEIPLYLTKATYSIPNLSNRALKL